MMVFPFVSLFPSLKAKGKVARAKAKVDSEPLNPPTHTTSTRREACDVV